MPDSSFSFVLTFRNDIVYCDDFEAIPSVDLYAWAEKAKAYRWNVTTIGWSLYRNGIPKRNIGTRENNLQDRNVGQGDPYLLPDNKK